LATGAFQVRQLQRTNRHDSRLGRPSDPNRRRFPAAPIHEALLAFRCLPRRGDQLVRKTLFSPDSFGPLDEHPKEVDLPPKHFDLLGGHPVPTSKRVRKVQVDRQRLQKCPKKSHWNQEDSRHMSSDERGREDFQRASGGFREDPEISAGLPGETKAGFFEILLHWRRRSA
jgi:hypothetical protein